MAKVSIIVPNYCHAPFLKRRLDSILAQDYSDYEVILLDDASTDDSLSIFHQYEQHPKVKVLIENESNSGNTFIQWDKGFSQAEGEYIWIAESDDVAEPHLLSSLVAQLEKDSRNVLAFCASEWIDENEQAIARRTSSRWQHDFRLDGDCFCRKYLLGYNYICNASAVVFRRTALAHIDDRYKQFRASGDRMFWIEIARQGHVCYVAEKLNMFRQHAHKVSGKASSQGQNIIQDHDIYTIEKPHFALTQRDKLLICGYHMRALRAPELTQEGIRTARSAWQNEPEFGYIAYAAYLASRTIEKLHPIH